MKTATRQPAGKRVMRIVMSFEDGHGAVKVTEGRKVDYYQVLRSRNDADRVSFHKEAAGGRFVADHFVDLDMGCCDCLGYRHRAKCRHVAAAMVLRERGCI